MILPPPSPHLSAAPAQRIHFVVASVAALRSAVQVHIPGRRTTGLPLPLRVEEAVPHGTKRRSRCRFHAATRRCPTEGPRWSPGGARACFESSVVRPEGGARGVWWAASQGGGSSAYWAYADDPDNAARCRARRRGPDGTFETRPRPATPIRTRSATGQRRCLNRPVPAYLLWPHRRAAAAQSSIHPMT